MSRGAFIQLHGKKAYHRHKKGGTSKGGRSCPGCSCPIPIRQLICTRCWVLKAPLPLKQLLGYVQDPRHPTIATDKGMLDDRRVIGLIFRAVRGRKIEKITVLPEAQQGAADVQRPQEARPATIKEEVEAVQRLLDALPGLTAP